MSRNPKHELFDHFARIGGALAHRARLQILDVLAQGEHSVDAISRKIGVPLKSTSAHLRTLRNAALVTNRREGTHVVYRLADASVHALLATLHTVAQQRSSEVRELERAFFDDPNGLEPLSRAELLRRFERDEITLLDVRPADEFAQAHITGAQSVPLDQLDAVLDALPRDRDIVAYCRGPLCLMATNAVRQLRRHGFTAHLLRDGVPEWSQDGLPITRADHTTETHV